MSMKGRADRLMGLYRLRAQVQEEIATLEALIDRENEAVERARMKWATNKLCGTDSGYYHHRRIQKEPACTPCKRAHAVAESDRQRRRADERNAEGGAA